MPLCHCVDAGGFTNGLSTSILLKASFHPLMIIPAVFAAKILRRVETYEKIIKIANQCLLFLPTAKYSRDLRAHKIKRITTVK